MMNSDLVAVIVGAGASVPYGLPTGSDLTFKAVEFLNSHSESEYDDFLEVAAPKNDFSALAQMMRRSRTPTIDHYIGQNSKLGPTLKTAIAGVLWNLESNALDPQEMPKDDWIAWLYHNFLDGKPDRFKHNKIVFISFNYDRLPLALMATMMANTHNIDCQDAMKICDDGSKIMPGGLEHRYFHVHGRINSPLCHSTVDYGRSIDRKRLSNRFPHTENGYPSPLDLLGKDIVTIHESSDTDLFPFIIAHAKTDVLLGFGYHDINLRRIGLGQGALEMVPENIRMGGTAFGITGFAREQLQGKLGPRFVLGNENEGCIQFLSRFLG